MPSTVPFRRLRLAALLLGVVFAGLARSQAWWDGDWTLRKLITIDTTATGVAINDPIGSAPILIRLHDGDFRFAAAKSDGTDLRFIAADDKTPLNFHIEKFDSLLNEAFVWVNVPDLKPGTKTTFWLYYGNAGPKAVKAENPKGTYDADTVLVYHFNEKGQAPYDFSGQGNGASNPGITADGSLIGSGLRLDGHTGVNLPATPSLSWTEGASLTWSAWVKFGAPIGNAIIFSRRDGGTFLILGADNGAPFVAFSSRGGAVRTSPGAALAPGWHHLAMVAGGGRLGLYVDGDSYASASGSLPTLNNAAIIGGDGAAVASAVGFAGELDELEISRVARPAGFLKLAAVEQGPDAGGKSISVGDDEAPSSWFSFLTKGYLGVILGSLTPDGWAVIAILAVMSIVSWGVMVSKAMYLNRVGKSNAEFIRRWREVATDLSVIDQPEVPADAAPAAPLDSGSATATATATETVKATRKRRATAAKGSGQTSPLFQIYHLGISEIRNRLDGDKDGRGKRAISARSIEAIRATLDGGFVRESQRLSSQMVLLTIAISGGPFLGLLGTVVGVMITFAAVAQAGEVNVNAIAPGIAAALAATVAGLGVAIPALFGYNYLLGRIKSTTSDMQVFIDEFVTRLAEFYGDD